MNKLLLWSSLLLFVACKGNSNKEAATIDSTTVITDELAEDDEIAPLAKAFTSLDSNFNTGSFYPSGTDSVRLEQLGKIDSGSLKEFLPYLIYNADSSLAIDPYSYNYIIHERNGKPSISEAGPDVEIGLVDMKKSTRRRLWFSGPSTAILDAKWKNNKEIWLSGMEALDTAGHQPFILSIDVSNNQVQRWQSDEIINTEEQDILKQRLQAQLNKPKTNRVF